MSPGRRPRPTLPPSSTTTPVAAISSPTVISSLPRLPSVMARSSVVRRATKPSGTCTSSLRRHQYYGAPRDDSELPDELDAREEVGDLHLGGVDAVRAVDGVVLDRRAEVL